MPLCDLSGDELRSYAPELRGPAESGGVLGNDPDDEQVVG